MAAMEIKTPELFFEVTGKARKFKLELKSGRKGQYTLLLIPISYEGEDEKVIRRVYVPQGVKIPTKGTVTLKIRGRLKPYKGFENISWILASVTINKKKKNK